MARVIEGRNRATPEEAASYLDKLDELEKDREAELRKIDNDAKAAKRKVNARIKEEQEPTFEDAKGQGVNKGTLKALLAKRKDDRKAERIIERGNERIDSIEEDDEREFATDILKALGDFGDLPLGAAAVAKGKDGEPEQDERTAGIVETVAKDEAAKSGKAKK